MSIKQLINSFLEKSLLLQIATSVDGMPWICTVCFAYDSDFNLYWFSRHNTRHSQEITYNPQVAGTIVPPYAFGDKSRGLQIVGTAKEFHEKKDSMVGLLALQKRYAVKDKRVSQLVKEIVLGTADYGLYCLRPNTIFLYDALTFPESPKKEFEVKNITSKIHTAQSHSEVHR